MTRARVICALQDLYLSGIGRQLSGTSCRVSGCRRNELGRTLHVPSGRSETGTTTESESDCYATSPGKFRHDNDRILLDYRNYHTKSWCKCCTKSLIPKPHEPNPYASGWDEGSGMWNIRVYCRIYLDFLELALGDPLPGTGFSGERS